MGTKQGIHLLLILVGLIPIDASLGREVETEAHPLADALAERHGVRSGGTDGVHGHERHALALIAYRLILAIDLQAVGVVGKGGMGQTVARTPLKAVVEGRTAQGGLDATAATLAGVHHHTTEAVGACHDRQLLVAHLHVIGGEVEVQGAREEVEVGAKLIVPARLGLIGDGLVHAVIVGLGVRHVIVALLCATGVGHELGLKDVREHLYVEAA